MLSAITERELVKPRSTRTWNEAKSEIAMIEPGIHWYAIHCAGAPEARVVDCLRNVNWNVYVPHCLELRAVPKRKLTATQRNSPFVIKRPVPVPLFPRYPFVQFDLRDPKRHDMFELLGVQGMICDGTNAKPQPAYIPDIVIAALAAQESDGALRSGTSLRELAYKLGETVRISTGVFAGHNATVDELPDVPIERLDEGCRLKLLVVLFGRENVVELTLADIQKL